MANESIFLDVAAVEAWDTWFRWRENGRLRDRTIEATWERVARALAGAGRTGHQVDYMAACAAWRLLPDERVLATAGTELPSWTADGLVAVVNAAQFVRDARTPRACFDAAEFAATAELAVFLLDDAAAAAPRGVESSRLRIGVIGVADALDALDQDYGTPEACVRAGEIGFALAEGCLRGSARLAAERGPGETFKDEQWRRACERGMSPGVVDEVRRYGVRYTQLTAVTPQPRLARLANNVTDAIDAPRRPFPPLVPGNPVSGGPGIATARDSRSWAYARMQVAMREALQPWIDEPIAYPLVMPFEQPR